LLAVAKPLGRAPCSQPHDTGTDDEEGDRAGGDAGSEGPEADAEAEAAGEEEEGADEDLSQAPPRTVPHPVVPPSPGPAAWLCRFCEHDKTPFGDTVTIMCQARDAPQGCCWHLGCLRGKEERCAARRAQMVPHSRWASSSSSARA